MYASFNCHFIFEKHFILVQNRKVRRGKIKKAPHLALSCFIFPSETGSSTAGDLSCPTLFNTDLYHLAEKFT